MSNEYCSPFRAVQALRLRKGFCGWELDQREEKLLVEHCEKVRALRDASSDEVFDTLTVPGADVYCAARSAGKFGLVAPERAEGLAAWEKESLAALASVKRPGRFVVLENTSIVDCDKEYQDLLQDLNDYAMSSVWRRERERRVQCGEEIPNWFKPRPVRQVAQEFWTEIREVSEGGDQADTTLKTLPRKRGTRGKGRAFKIRTNI